MGVVKITSIYMLNMLMEMLILISLYMKTCSIALLVFPTLVRQLRTIFSLNVDTADNSVNFFPHVFHCLKFTFLIGADHEINYSCPYLVFKMAALCHRFI